MTNLNDKFEKVNCVLCGADHTNTLLIKDDYNIEKCKNCSLVYINPRPTKEELTNLYSNDDFSDIDDATQKSILKKLRTGLDLIHQYCSGPGEILDIGCSTGYFLNFARDFGWKTLGIDVNQNVIEYAKKKFNLDVKAGELEESNFPDNQFDAVTLFDVIEHLPNPLLTLKEVYRIVKPNGIVLLTTPNIDGIFPKLTYFLFAKTIGAWEHPTPPGHLYQFSRRTIRRILENANLKVLFIKSYEIPLQYTVGKLENSIIESIKNNYVNSTNSTKNYLTDNDTFKNSNGTYSLLDKVKKIPRVIVKVACWVLVFLIYFIAHILKKGDSIFVIAQKV